MTHRKIGFWAVLSITIGSQIGTGIFMLPMVLAPYGHFGLSGLTIAGGAVLCLAAMFAMLCSYFPKNGGPHVYIQNAFGSHFAFFVGWSYWLVSWVSTSVVIIASITYLSPFIGDRGPLVYLFLEIVLLGFITLLNLKGAHTAGRAELFLAILKFAPLLILPIFALYSFNSNNFIVNHELSSLSITKILGQAAFLSMFGFVGVETGTTIAGSVKNPTKTIPKALIFGTLCVACLYFLNNIGIMGLMPAETLIQSKAPFADAAQHMFGGNWYLIVAVIVSLVCIGTANAWTLTSGQTILGLAEDGLMPKLFMKTNTHKSPIWGILVSSIGIIMILICTTNKNLGQQITNIIDYSVSGFLFVYLMCSFAAVKMALKKQIKPNILQWIAIIISIIFCSWAIYTTPIWQLGIASLFILSGLPIYLFWYLKNIYAQ